MASAGFASIQAKVSGSRGILAPERLYAWRHVTPAHRANAADWLSALAPVFQSRMNFIAHQTTPTILSGSHRTKTQAAIASRGTIQGPMNLIARLSTLSAVVWRACAPLPLAFDPLQGRTILFWLSLAGRRKAGSAGGVSCFILKRPRQMRAQPSSPEAVGFPEPEGAKGAGNTGGS